MFSRFLKIIGIFAIFAIFVIVVGHHSLQAEAMNHVGQHDSSQCTVGVECEHSKDIEICNKIQSDKVQVSVQPFILSSCSYFLSFENDFSKLNSIYYDNEYQRVEISHSQLARSHL